MAITERVRGYEVLIRLNANGTIGAHYTSISEVLRDGAVISASILDPVPLTTVESDPGHDLSSILGDFSVTLISANEALADRVAALLNELDSANLNIASLRTATS